MAARPCDLTGKAELLPSLSGEVLAILKKDLRSELRTRYALNALLMFAIITLAAISFSLSGSGLTPGIHAALLWVVIFFSSMSGLSRIFVKEEESRTVSILRLSASPIAVYLGKLLFNVILLIILDCLLVPLAIIFLHLPVNNWWLFIPVIGLGSLGLAGASTILAAMVAGASSKGPLFAVLAFPILLPLLVTSIHGTLFALQGRSILDAAGDLRILVSYLGVMLTASLILFESVWSE